MYYKHNIILRILMIHCLVLLIFLLQIGVLSEEIVSHSDFLMDTYVTIKVVVDDNSFGKSMLDNSFEIIRKYEKVFDNYDSESEVSSINRDAFKLPIKLSKEMMDLLKASGKISELSNGAFDLTISPLIELWNFKAEKPSIPDASSINQLLPLVNYKNVVINTTSQGVHFLKEGTKMDLGGISKGYIIDKVADFLKEKGIKSALIDAGGDICAFGKKPDNSDWIVALKDPRADGVIAKFPLRDCAIATSGDYERYFIVDGKRYHHLLNPKTGYPVNDTISMSVIAKDATTADGLATAAFIIGGKKALEFLKDLDIDSLEGIVIYPVSSTNQEKGEKYKILVTENLAKEITIIK